MLLVFAGKCKCKWPVVPDRIWGAGSDGKGCQILTWQPWWPRLLCRMSQPPESSTEPRHSSLCRLFKSWLTKNVMIGAAYARHGARQGQRIPLAQYKEVDLHCTFFRKNTESVLTAESR